MRNTNPITDYVALSTFPTAGIISSLITNLANFFKVGATNIAGFLDDGTPYYKKRKALGFWNMNTTNSITVTHDLTDKSKILSVSCIIIADMGDYFYNINSMSNNTDPILLWGGIEGISDTIVVVQRRTGGNFDNVVYESMEINRGYLIIDYIL